MFVKFNSVAAAETLTTQGYINEADFLTTVTMVAGGLAVQSMWPCAGFLDVTLAAAAGVIF